MSNEILSKQEKSRKSINHILYSEDPTDSRMLKLYRDKYIKKTRNHHANETSRKLVAINDQDMLSVIENVAQLSSISAEILDAP